MQPNESPPPLDRSGLFLALEGPDGSGKTTQAGLLVEGLRGRGREVIACRDPGGTPLGERLRSILLDRSNLAIDLRAEMLLYNASRAQLVADVIRPAMEAGRVVVSDRYVLSNVVYQGYAGGLDVDDVWRVCRSATGGLMPDLTVLIDVPPGLAQARVGAARDRMEDRPEEFRRRVREGYLTASKSYPGAIVTIDGSADADAVAARVREEVARALGIDPGT